MNSNDSSQMQASLPLEGYSTLSRWPIGKKITLQVKGLVPSFKTQKSAIGWVDKASGKIFARPMTKPEHKKWMQNLVQSFESQLRAALPMTESTISTEQCLRSWMLSLPLDDRWQVFPHQLNLGRRCLPGEEVGVTITIERIE